MSSLIFSPDGLSISSESHRNRLVALVVENLGKISGVKALPAHVALHALFEQDAA